MFEIIVARALQMLGAEIVIEQESVGGRRPDFVADFEGYTVIVEAIAPEFGQGTQREQRANDLLFNLIELRVPDGWSILIVTLPKFGPAEPKAGLKTALDEIFAKSLSPQDDGRRIQIQLPQGPLELLLLRGMYGESKIVGRPVYTSWSDSEERILHALKKKRQQVRSLDAPVLLAVNASGIASSFDDFDGALFGRDTTRLDESFVPRKTLFDRSGVFAKGEGASTYAGIWAFVDVSPFACKGPVLYVHPSGKWNLPWQFERCERRILTGHGIEIIPGTDRSFLDRLGWAKL